MKSVRDMTDDELVAASEEVALAAGREQVANDTLDKSNEQLLADIRRRTAAGQSVRFIAQTLATSEHVVRFALVTGR